MASMIQNYSYLKINFPYDLCVLCYPCKVILNMQTEGYACELNGLAEVFNLLSLGLTSLECTPLNIPSSHT